jgi:hypothetical protein
MITLIILGSILVYAISFYGAYKYIQVSHSKGDIWYNLTPEGMDYCMVFIPILNTFFAIIAWLFWYPNEDNGNNNSINFFNLKR